MARRLHRIPTPESEQKGEKALRQRHVALDQQRGCSLRRADSSGLLRHAQAGHGATRQRQSQLIDWYGWRASSIAIDQTKIKPERKHDFQMISAAEGMPVGNYDLDSIMHYGASRNASIDGKTVIMSQANGTPLPHGQTAFRQATSQAPLS